MQQSIAFTKKTDLNDAVADLTNQMPGNNYNLIMFFASVSYDFSKLSAILKEKYPNSEVVGCSTSGEISKYGFTNNSIIMTGMTCNQTKVKGVIIEDADKYPYIYKKQIIDTMQSVGISVGKSSSHLKSFAFTFINGLCNAEEAILATLYGIIDNPDFQLLGGSAGDDLKFDTTYVSLNGEVVTNGAVVVFVNTNKKFTIIKENIFKPSGKTLELTKVDPKKRIVHTINNKPSANAYADALGIPTSKVMDNSLLNPIGRNFGNDIFISSIASMNEDKSFGMYCRVMQNTTVELMEIDDIKGKMDETIEKIKSMIPNAGFVFFINCILRTLQFNNDGNGKYLVEQYNKNFEHFCGFSSYGEQIGRVNSNQTLVVLAMEG